MPAPTTPACGCYLECKKSVCADSFTFQTDYQDTEIIVELTDLHGNVYPQTITTDETGLAEFLMDGYDPNPFAENGTYVLRAFAVDSEGCEPLEFTRGEETYLCLNIEFYRPIEYVTPNP